MTQCHSLAYLSGEMHRSFRACDVPDALFRSHLVNLCMSFHLSFTSLAFHLVALLPHSGVFLLGYWFLRLSQTTFIAVRIPVHSFSFIWHFFFFALGSYFFISCRFSTYLTLHIFFFLHPFCLSIHAFLSLSLSLAFSSFFPLLFIKSYKNLLVSFTEPLSHVISQEWLNAFHWI